MRGLLGITANDRQHRNGKLRYILPHPLQPGQPIRYSTVDPSIRFYNPQWDCGTKNELNNEYLGAVVANVMSDDSV